MKKELSGLNPCSNGRYSLSKAGAKSVKNLKVLILVLMEDTLWDFSVTGYICKDAEVLILVLMEDTLWVETLVDRLRKGSLNPCSNGRYSLSHYLPDMKFIPSLNPCSNGRYSLRAKT